MTVKINFRLNEVRKYLRLSQRSIAEELNISHSTWQKIEMGSNFPSVETLLSFSNLGINPGWILTGQGEMLLSNEEDVKFSKNIKGETDDFTFIPRIMVSASAGYGRTQEADLSSRLVAFRTEWLHRIGIPPNRAQALTAQGDSMEPSIKDGDLLLIDRSVNQLQDEGIYVVTLDDMVLVKRILQSIDAIILKSDNPLYDDQIIKNIDLEKVRIEGRVRWFGRIV